MQVMVDNIIKLGEVFSNPLRRRIVEILVDKGPKNITDLQYELEIRSYKNVHKHVKDLLEIGAIETINAPHKEGVKLKVSREAFFKFLSEAAWYDLRNMYPPFPYGKLNKYIKSKKEVTEEELKSKFPELKYTLRWYLLLFGKDYNLKISANGKKAEDKR